MKKSLSNLFRARGGTCGPGCWPLESGGCDCGGQVMRTQLWGLGARTKETAHKSIGLMGLGGPWEFVRGDQPALPTAVKFASAAASAYHGVKRNRGSIGWGIVWFALGAFFPTITPAVAVVQGYGKVK